MEMKDLMEMMEAMDPAEKKLALAADDAMDRLYTYRLQRDYGVMVECNPGGDRTKIAIDGVVMNQLEFADWLMEKQMAECEDEDDDCEYEGYEAEECEDEDALPGTVVIAYSELVNGGDSNNKDVYAYLRKQYEHYLSGEDELPVCTWNDNTGLVTVTGIHWGRKK